MGINIRWSAMLIHIGCSPADVHYFVITRWPPTTSTTLLLVPRWFNKTALGCLSIWTSSSYHWGADRMAFTSIGLWCFRCFCLSAHAPFRFEPHSHNTKARQNGKGSVGGYLAWFVRGPLLNIRFSRASFQDVKPIIYTGSPSKPRYATYQDWRNGSLGHAINRIHPHAS